MFLKSLTMRNFLSFGPDSDAISLRPLNILIGPNGSGKSNLLESIALLQSAPNSIVTPIREGGGVRDWLWKGGERQAASIEVEIAPTIRPNTNLRYKLEFAENASRFNIIDERIENSKPYPGHEEVYFYYKYENNHPVLNIQDVEGEKSKKRILRLEEIDPQKSILAQRRDPYIYPEITWLAEAFADIRIYRDWVFGRYTPPRLPQPTDLPNKWLEESCRNLGLVLNRLKRDIKAKKLLLDMLQAIYPDVCDVDVMIEGGTAQVFVQEGSFTMPATRLSDGTLRYLCLLTVLLHPDPPRLICIDEPEQGMHPDLISNIAEALRIASERTQLIISTHSVQLVDAFSNDPECVLVCEKHNGASKVRRLDSVHLKPWLEKFSLGTLWTSGEIGGNRW